MTIAALAFMSLAAFKLAAGGHHTATTYYVSPAGNDAWSGTSPAYVSGTNGPWATLHRAATGMMMDDVTLVRGGFYDCSTNSKQYFDATFSSVTLSNYPGETPWFANLTGSRALIDVERLANVKVSGINATNCQRTVLFQNATNCELANCDLGYTDPSSTFTGLVAVVSCSRSNWIHANNLHDSHSDYTTTPQSAKGTPFLLGTQETNPVDYTAYNRVELNQFFHGGNDCLQVQANCNIIRSNWFHNEPWVTWNDYGQAAGNRNLVISPRSQGNVIDYNQVGYAGVSPVNPGGNGIEICGASNIVRFNEIFWSQQNGLLLDGGRNGGAITAGQCLGNHIYNNTLGWNSLGQLFATNLTTGAVVDLRGNLSVIQVNMATNNVFVNNLLAFSGSNQVVVTGGAVSDNVWLQNWDNYLHGDPLFLTNGGSFTTLVANVASGTDPNGVVVAGLPAAEPDTLVDMRLRVNSPCLRSGQFLTTATSDSGAGVSFTVADADYFSDGYGVVPGDIIAFEGTELQARIIKVDRVQRTLTMNTAVIWSTGQGVAIATAGTVPLIDTLAAGGPLNQNTAIMGGAWAPNMGANGTPDPSVSQVVPGH